MININGALDAFLFEWKRLMKFPRLAWWIGLAAFPPALVFLITSINHRPEQMHEYLRFAGLAYVLAGCCSNVLALLLSATPIIYSELEGKTWTYLAIRPHGKGSVLVGKYFAAVSWATTTSWAGLATSFLIVGTAELSTLWWSFCGMAFLTNIAIGAVMVFLGVLSLRRAMVFGLLYVIIFELVIAGIPAIISKITAAFYLRSLYVIAADSRRDILVPPEENPLICIGALLLYASVALGGALYVLHQRQLVTQQED